MKKILTSFRIPNIVYVLTLAFMVRIILSFFGTLQLDYGTFVAWSTNLSTNGLASFYNGWSDYLPGYPYILWLLGRINLFNIIPQVLLYKLPAILADLATGYAIYKILGERKGIYGAALYLFNPAVFANSTLWGQVDSLTSLFSILSVYLLNTNYILSAVLLAIGTAIKPQVAFLTPLILLLLIKNKFHFTKALTYIVTSFSTFVLLFVPFQNKPNLMDFVIGRLTISANQYQYTAVNAFNFWGIFGQWKPDNRYFQYGGYAVFLIAFLYLSKKLWNHKNFEYLMATFIFAFSFVFFTRMHERHLLPLFAPLTILTGIEYVYLFPLIGFSIVYIANLFYSYKWITQNFLISFDPLPFIIIIILSFLIMVYSMFNLEKVKDWLRSIFQFFDKGRNSHKEFVLTKIDIGKNKAKIILVLIIAFSFLTRTYRLGLPKNDYFDEIYHAFTARIVLHGDPKAWEWWNPHPEGFAYEWTHPPLSKLMMVGGMKIFGENSFGWRIPQAVFGTLAVYLIYLLTKKIFDDEVMGLISAFVFSLDGLGLVLSRMGMNDIYVLSFMLLTIYFFLDKKDFLSSISLGLAVASKWSAIWTIPILFVLWLRRRPLKDNPLKVVKTVLCFAILPFTFYLLTYLPMFLTGHDLGTWWGMQKQMWWYHTGLRATHPYTSSWWSWPLDMRPVYLYTSDEVSGMVSRIYALGNPIVFWFGLTSIVTSFIYAFVERNKRLGLIVFSYLIFFVPWALSPRIMFIYHYLPSIPFMCIAIAYVLRRTPKLIFVYLFICLLSFIYFYPHWAGLSVPLWLDKSYYWMSSWR